MVLQKIVHQVTTIELFAVRLVQKNVFILCLILTIPFSNEPQVTLALIHFYKAYLIKKNLRRTYFNICKN